MLYVRVCVCRDTLAMMRNSGQIMFLFSLYVIVILGYNIMAMKTVLSLAGSALLAQLADSLIDWRGHGHGDRPCT